MMGDSLTNIFNWFRNLKMRMMAFVLMLLGGLCFSNIAAGAPTVYTGYDISFAKVAFEDETLPANQDFILPDVIITRGMTRGIFNIAQESAFVDNSSPAGTAWAFDNNNPSATLSATNWENLVFEDWQTALGSAGSLATNILAGNAVLHLVDHDIYLDIRFTEWGVGAGTGGSFAYERSSLIPEPSGLLLISSVLLYSASLRRRQSR
jgi:hypothetical protein